MKIDLIKRPSAIIQARMTSSRLPGKVLKEVKGKPLLSYLIERLRLCSQLKKLVLATTTNAEDDPIARFAEKERLHIYRGSENDVLDRYYQAACMFQSDHVMRITADCPLIDPRLCDQLVTIYQESMVDYLHLGPSFAEGVDSEIFSFKALEQAWNGARLKSEREHVTLYLHNHPELFKKKVLTNDTDDSKYRFTVDEPADFQVVKAILEELYKEGASCFYTDEIKTFLDARPDLSSLNADIVRNEGLFKSLMADGFIS
ncbi:MAG: cytidylyltransferase domain-containing protein [bacterium]